MATDYLEIFLSQSHNPCGNDAYDIEAGALALFGIDPQGSFLPPLSGDNNTRQSPYPMPVVPTERELRRRLGQLPNRSFATMPIPKAPPSTTGCSHWPPATQHALLPSDYVGLGIDAETQLFNLPTLVRHCALAPNASEIARLLACETRRIVCQALRCAAVITPDTDAQACPHCALGVLCTACLRPGQPCRVCLLWATVKQPPLHWMFQRRAKVRDMLDNGGTKANSENADCHVTLITLLAPIIARKLISPALH